MINEKLNNFDEVSSILANPHATTSFIGKKPIPQRPLVQRFKMFATSLMLGVGVSALGVGDFKDLNNQNQPALQVVDFRPIPTYIPSAIHTIGLCNYEHKEHYKSVDVASDNKIKAMDLGRKLLNPSNVEHIKYVGSKRNEDYFNHQNKKPKFK